MGAEREGRHGRAQRGRVQIGRVQKGAGEGGKIGKDKEDSSAELSPIVGAQFCRTVWVQRGRAGEQGQASKGGQGRAQRGHREKGDHRGHRDGGHREGAKRV